MKKVWEFIKKYWQIFAGAIGALFAILAFRNRGGPPPHIQPPPEEPPPEKKPVDFVDEHKEEKRESDQRVDDMSTDELVDSINDEYG